MPISPVGRVDNRPAPPRPAPPRRAPPARGFTLIELLVVVTIVAVLSLGVGLTAGGVFARPEGGQAARIESAVARLRDAALLGRQHLGLHPRAEGWQAVRRDDSGLWQPMGPPVVLPGPAAGWTIAGRPHLPALNPPRPQDAPLVQFGADGGSTPFALTLTQGTTRLTCRAAAGEGVRCDTP